MKIFTAEVKDLSPQKINLGDFLHLLTTFSPKDLISAALKGSVWIKRHQKRGIFRIRNLKETIYPEDKVWFYYDIKILKLPEIESLECLYEDKNYGVWFKPSGILSQGTQAGDHTSVLRYVEKVKKKDVFLVHRLDRETSGPMLVAYDSKSANKLSEMFSQNKILKEYEAVVLGKLPANHKGTINLPLDDKESITHYEVLSSNENSSHIKITIETGRFHQIRRHLSLIGHPVWGDPKYGNGNKNKSGLKLAAVSLAFVDPWTREEKKIVCPSELSFL